MTGHMHDAKIFCARFDQKSVNRRSMTWFVRYQESRQDSDSLTLNLSAVNNGIQHLDIFQLLPSDASPGDITVAFLRETMPSPSIRKPTVTWTHVNKLQMTFAFSISDCSQIQIIFGSRHAFFFLYNLLSPDFPPSQAISILNKS